MIQNHPSGSVFTVHWMFIKYVRYDSSSVLLHIIIVILDANIEHHERVQSSIAVKAKITSGKLLGNLSANVALPKEKRVWSNWGLMETALSLCLSLSLREQLTVFTSTAMSAALDFKDSGLITRCHCIIQNNTSSLHTPAVTKSLGIEHRWVILEGCSTTGTSLNSLQLHMGALIFDFHSVFLT